MRIALTVCSPGSALLGNRLVVTPSLEVIPNRARRELAVEPAEHPEFECASLDEVPANIAPPVMAAVVTKDHVNHAKRDVRVRRPVHMSLERQSARGEWSALPDRMRCDGQQVHRDFERTGMRPALPPPHQAQPPARGSSPIMGSDAGPIGQIPTDRRVATASRVLS
jgi:hypothetical protein